MPKGDFSQSWFIPCILLLMIFLIAYFGPKIAATVSADIPKSQPTAQRPPTIGEAQKTQQQQIDDLKQKVWELRAELAECRRQISDLRIGLKFANGKINELDERTKNITPHPRYQPILRFDRPILLPPIQR